MGVFKPYGGIRAMNFVMFQNSTGDMSVPNFYAANNSAAYNTIYTNGNCGYSNLKCMSNLVPNPTADLLANYNPDDYVVSAVANASKSLDVNATAGTATMTITMTASSEVSVSCIKFVNAADVIYAHYNSGIQNVLMCGYFFDEPIVLNADNNYTATVVINFMS